MSRWRKQTKPHLASVWKFRNTSQISKERSLGIYELEPKDLIKQTTLTCLKTFAALRPKSSKVWMKGNLRERIRGWDSFFTYEKGCAEFTILQGTWKVEALAWATQGFFSSLLLGLSCAGCLEVCLTLSHVCFIAGAAFTPLWISEYYVIL